MPADNNSFLAPKGDYKRLIAFQKSECIYDITFYFIEHYLPKIGDRTVDQMKQAARSGKQNIAEGNETGTTSMEACIKLVNVAKASLKELQEDYEDYLRNHGNKIWNASSQQCLNARAWCKEHSKPADYLRVCELRDDITLANVALVLIHQTDYLLHRLIEKYKTEFLAHGAVPFGYCLPVSSAARGYSAARVKRLKSQIASSASCFFSHCDTLALSPSPNWNSWSTRQFSLRNLLTRPLAMFSTI